MNEFYTISENDPTSEQPDTIVNIELYLHQKMSLHKMKEIERGNFDYKNTHSKYLDVSERFVTYNGNIGILSDRPGSGKSLTLLSLIASNPIFLPKSIDDLAYQGRHYNYKTEDYNKKEIFTSKISVTTNLIIVPEHLESQWETYIKTYTKLKFYVLYQTKDFKSEDEMIEIFNTYDIILLSSKVYVFLGNLSEIILFSRCIMDEADSLKIKGVTKIPHPSANFYWIITSSYKSLFSQRNSRQIFNEILKDFPMYKTILNTVIVRNNQDVIDQSIIIPKPILERFIVKDPYFMRAISGFLDKETTILINSGNINAAILRLNIGQDTKDNIIDTLSGNLQIQLDNLELELKYRQNKTYPTKTLKNTAVSETKESINILKNKIENLKDRINDIDRCPICLEEEYIDPCLAKCCAKKYCFLCIQGCLKFNNKCPNCNSKIDNSFLINIVEKVKTAEKKETFEIGSEKYIFDDKINAFMYVFNKLATNAKVIVFSNQDIFFESIIREINEPYFKLTGKIVDKNSVEKFEKCNGKCILFLNSQIFSTGLNLQFATNIINLDKVSQETKIQIHHRILRPGLKHTPTFTDIFYENEC